MDEIIDLFEGNFELHEIRLDRMPQGGWQVVVAGLDRYDIRIEAKGAAQSRTAAIIDCRDDLKRVIEERK